ncbi:hypothetical protein vseg_011728 [Gypsophila vaccaria]
MHQIKTCTLELANLRKPMDPEDIIPKVIRGLNSPHYRAIKEMVEARDSPISFDPLHKKLINHDLRQPESTSITNFSTIAYAASYRGHSHHQSTRATAHSSPMPRPDQTVPTAPTREVSACQYCGYKGHTFNICRNFKKAHPHFILTPDTRPQRY